MTDTSIAIFIIVAIFAMCFIALAMYNKSKFRRDKPRLSRSKIDKRQINEFQLFTFTLQNYRGKLNSLLKQFESGEENVTIDTDLIVGLYNDCKREFGMMKHLLLSEDAGMFNSTLTSIANHQKQLKDGKQSKEIIGLITAETDKILNLIQERYIEYTD